LSSLAVDDTARELEDVSLVLTHLDLALRTAFLGDSLCRVYSNRTVLLRYDRTFLLSDDIRRFSGLLSARD
jgi:hypothetical protein